MSYPDMTNGPATEAPLWDHTRSVVAARILVEVGEEQGVAPATALAATGLRRSDLLDPNLAIEAGQEMAIARNILQRLGFPPGLGCRAGARYTLGSLGLWGFALATSPTVGDLVRLGTRYSALSFAFIRPVYLDEPACVRVRYEDDEIPEDVRDFFVERELAKLLVLAPAVFGGIAGFHVETKFEDRRVAALQQISGGCDVLPGSTDHALVFTRDILNKPLPQADPVTAQVFEAQCAELIKRRQRRRGSAAQVRGRILAQLKDPPGIEDVAHQMHIEERTLRRKLAAEGTSFRELVDEVRSTMAAELLIEAQLTVEEVAVRLGYNDAAAFSRAFKRWTGERPGSYRLART